jgi:hypothetical protein
MLGIGIDIGGTNTKLVVVNRAGKLLAHERFRTEASKGPASFIKRLGAVVAGFRKDYGRQLVSIGIGAAGDVDPEKGVLRFSPNLAWRSVKLAGPLEKLTGLPCAMENDANMAAWGAYEIELRRKTEDILTLTLGTGIGSGMILGGKLYHGSTGSAGEAGHLKIVPDGRPCHCGARGCLEAYCGSYAIIAGRGADQERRLHRSTPSPAMKTQYYLPHQRRGRRPRRRAQGLGGDGAVPGHGAGRPDTAAQSRLRGPDRRGFQGPQVVHARHAESAEPPADQNAFPESEDKDLRQRRPRFPRRRPFRAGARIK